MTDPPSDRPSAAAVAEAFGLSGRVGELVPVAGAWSNRVYRLQVGDAAYAVKELLDTWRQATWFERLDEAWRFELVAIDAGVSAPAPVANPGDGSWHAEVECTDGRSTAIVRLHRWVDSVPIPGGVAGVDLAQWSGATLARLHDLEHRTNRPDLFPTFTTDGADRWPALVEAAETAQVPWLRLAQEATPAVEAIRRHLETAAAPSPDRPVSHRDVDQKNILLAGSGPALCDWDVAGPVDPAEELADVALSMARWEAPSVARTVLDAYRRAGGDALTLTPRHVAPMLFSSVDWLVLNVERALDLRDRGPEEQERGEALVPGLLDRLPRRVEMAEHIDRWLAS